MGKTAVGLYETSTEAQQVLNELVQAGFDRSNIRIMLGDQSTRRLREWYEEQPATAGTLGSQWSGDASATLVACGESKPSSGPEPGSPAGRYCDTNDIGPGTVQYGGTSYDEECLDAYPWER